MGKRKKHIMKNSDHPSNEEWVKYLKHELSEEEAHALEASILDDEFEWDAMEGLEQLSTPDSIDNTLKDIKQKILKRSDVNKYPRRKYNYLADVRWGLYSIFLILMIVILTIIIIQLLKD
ncbi:hypothetical protein [Gynurincola endophyticus]|jgi:hypothetical protein|uniref:hypothetical protein n=1 Tax=Gynurincola endophyticus TaxID=2479004 RepID=UPI001315A588|nr:hypothetical protein [Gynurincola endophyticus]